MLRASMLAPSLRSYALVLPLLVAAMPALMQASSPTPAPASTNISGQDADGHAVQVNGKGHVTLVMYTNPDLEDESRKMSLALDPYRSRSDFNFVRVVDLRGDVPPNMRSMVRTQIRKEIARESERLKKAGVSGATPSPIIPDFSGSTLNALGWDSTYEKVRLVVYDAHGHELKRFQDVTDAKQMAKVVESVL